MMSTWLSRFALAQTSAATTTGGGTGTGGGSGSGGGFMQMVIPLLIIFGVMYIFIFMPQRKKEKQRRQMLDAIQKGDDVVTIGGICGKVWQLKDQEVILQVSDNMKLTFSRGAIARVEKKGDKVE